MDVAKAILATFLAAELLAWMPKLFEWLIGQAAKRLPTEHCDRYLEEWLAHAYTLPTFLQKALHALSLFFTGADKITRGITEPKLAGFDERCAEILDRHADDRKKLERLQEEFNKFARLQKSAEIEMQKMAHMKSQLASMLSSEATRTLAERISALEDVAVSVLKESSSADKFLRCKAKTVAERFADIGRQLESVILQREQIDSLPIRGRANADRYLLAIDTLEVALANVVSLEKESDVADPEVEAFRSWRGIGVRKAWEALEQISRSAAAMNRS